MTNFFKKWREFISETPPESTDGVQLLNESRLDGSRLLNEIRPDVAEKVMSVLYDNVDADTSLSFSQMFGGAIRASVPMRTQLQGPVGDIITLFENFGFDVDLADGTISRTDTINYDEVAMNIFNSMLKKRSSDSLRSKVNLLADTFNEGPYAMTPDRIGKMFFGINQSNHSLPERLANPESFQHSGMHGRTMFQRLKDGSSKESAAEIYVIWLKDSIERVVNDSAISKANMEWSKKSTDQRDATGGGREQSQPAYWTHPKFGDLRTELFKEGDLKEVINIMLAVADKAPKPGTKKTTKLKIGKALEKVHGFADKIEQLLDRARANPAAASPEEAKLMPGGAWDTDLASHNFQEIRFLKDASWFGEARAILKQLSNLLPYSDGFPSQGLIEKGKESEWIKKDLLNFWNRKSQFYRENPAEAYGSPYTIIFSRHPVDVVRMSDFATLSSCHAEGHSHFHCAVAEAKGHGPIAYVVRTDQLDSELERHGVENINELDDEEIFNDPQRDVRGIEPISRIRLRKLMNAEEDYELAIPEIRVYGKKFPGFLDAVLDWARERQMDRFQSEHAPDEYTLPEKDEFRMHGGSYTDTPGGTMLKRFFDPHLKPGEAKDKGYYGNVPWEGVEEEEEMANEEIYEEYITASHQVQDNADYSLRFASVSHNVQRDVGIDGEPAVFFTGEIEMSFEGALRGFSQEHLKTPPAARRSDFGWISEHDQIVKDVEEILDSQHGLHPDDVRVVVRTHIEHTVAQLDDILNEQNPERSFAASFNEPQKVSSYNPPKSEPEPEPEKEEVKIIYITGAYTSANDIGEYDDTPAGFSEFVDYMKDQDDRLDQAKESVRIYLRDKGLLPTSTLDKYADEFQKETEAFKSFDWDYNKGFLILSTERVLNPGTGREVGDDDDDDIEKSPGLYLGVINNSLDAIAEFYPKVEFMEEPNVSPKSLYNEYAGEIFSGPGFKMYMQDHLQGEIEDARKEARRQLALDLDDDKEALDPAKDEYMRFDHAKIYIHTIKKAEGYEHIYDAYLQIVFKLSTRIPKESLIAAIEFVKVLDQQHLPKIVAVAQKLLTTMLEASRTAQSKFNKIVQDISSKTLKELIGHAQAHAEKRYHKGRVVIFGVPPSREKDIDIERELGRRSFPPEFWAELATTKKDTIVVTVMSTVTSQWIGKEKPVTPDLQAYAKQMLRFIYAQEEHSITFQDFDAMGYGFKKDILQTPNLRSWKSSYVGGHRSIPVEEAKIKKLIEEILNEN